MKLILPTIDSEWNWGYFNQPKFGTLKITEISKDRLSYRDKNGYINGINLSEFLGFALDWWRPDK